MLLKLKNIQKTYYTKTGVTFRALSGVSTAFDDTGLVFLVGKSGSGKSTLLNIIGGLDSYDIGDIIVGGKSMKKLSAADVDYYRNTVIGFVFQEFNLLETLNVTENIKLSLQLRGTKDDESVRSALSKMDILDKAEARPKNLSGGQRQRVAIARALVKDPKIILADEPTGSLDYATGNEVMSLFKQLSRDRLVIVVTHDMERALSMGDRIIEMKDGKIYRDVRRKKKGEVIEQSSVSVTSDTLIRVDKGVKLNQADADKINEILSTRAAKTYINFETDTRKIKALFPNLREAVEQHDDEKGAETVEKKPVEDEIPAVRAEPETEDNRIEKQSGFVYSSNSDAVLAAAMEADARQKDEEYKEVAESEVKEKFIPYKPKEDGYTDIEYKKSRLPAKTALRLGVNNLNQKKGRLVLLVIMAVFALSLFGLAQSFVNYDLVSAVGKTLSRENVPIVALANNDSAITDYKFTKIRDRELAELREKFSELKIMPNYNFSAALGTTSAIGGVVETADVGALGFPILYGSGKFTAGKYDEIVVSESMAYQLVAAMTGVSSIQKLVGKSYSAIEGLPFTIIGIFRSTDFSSDTISIGGGSYISAATDAFAYNMFVNNGFMSNLYDILPGLDVSVNLVGTPTLQSLLGKQLFSTAMVFAPDEIVSLFSGIDKNTMILSSSLITSSGIAGNGAINYDTINNDADRALTVSLETNSLNMPLYASSAFKVLDLSGFGEIGQAVNDYINSYDGNVIILHPDLKEEIYGNIFYPTQLFVSVKDSGKTASVVKHAYDNGMKVTMEYVSGYELLVSLLDIAGYSMYAIAGILLLLVIVLMYNFISFSITYSKKQIGILRALGTKKFDTYKIFVMEGFIILLFSLLLSYALIFGLGEVVNVAFKSQMAIGYYFAIINVGWTVALTMLAATVLLSLISVLIPMRKYNRITPIEAISTKS